jgi:hypothetical protein
MPRPWWNCIDRPALLQVADALTQAVLMTVLRTLKRRGLNPLEELTAAFRHYAQTDLLPQLN